MGVDIPPWLEKLVTVCLVAYAIFHFGPKVSSWLDSQDVMAKKVSDVAKTDPATDPGGSQVDKKAKLGSERNPAPRGYAVGNGDVRYRVDDVTLGDVGSNGGRWVVVTVTVENISDETINVGNNDFKLEVAGYEIDASMETPDSVDYDDEFVLEEISPGLKRTGKVAFEVRTQDAGRGVLRAKEWITGGSPAYLSLQ